MKITDAKKILKDMQQENREYTFLSSEFAEVITTILEHLDGANNSKVVTEQEKIKWSESIGFNKLLDLHIKHLGMTATPITDKEICKIYDLEHLDKPDALTSEIGDDDKLREIVFTALGEASMCWSEIPKGIFDSVGATIVGDKLLKDISEYQKSQIKTKE